MELVLVYRILNFLIFKKSFVEFIGKIHFVSLNHDLLNEGIKTEVNKTLAFSKDRTFCIVYLKFLISLLLKLFLLIKKKLAVFSVIFYT